MPKLSFPANAEGLPKFSRRSILKLAPAAVLATGGAIAALTLPSLANPPSQTDDSLEEMLQLWRQLTEEQKRNVLDFLRRAHAASLEC